MSVWTSVDLRVKMSFPVAPHALHHSSGTHWKSCDSPSWPQDAQLYLGQAAIFEFYWESEGKLLFSCVAEVLGWSPLEMGEV